jgi:hypothetical protein
MEVTREQLAKAVDGMEVAVDVIGAHVVGTWIGAKLRYPGGFADAVFARIAEQPKACPESAPAPAATNHEEAGQALSASTWQRQKWGDGGSKDELRSAAWELERAKVHALLDVADAIREQTAVMVGDGIRVLAERNQ